MLSDKTWRERKTLWDEFNDLDCLLYQISSLDEEEEMVDDKFREIVNLYKARRSVRMFPPDTNEEG